MAEEFRSVRQYITAQEVDQVVFNWLGGEPALRRVGFLQQSGHPTAQARGRQDIENDFQTNGVLVDEAWCAFLKRNGFYVILSIGGPRRLHNRMGTVKGGAPTFDRVLRAVRCCAGARRKRQASSSFRSAAGRIAILRGNRLDTLASLLISLGRLFPGRKRRPPRLRRSSETFCGCSWSLTPNLVECGAGGQVRDHAPSSGSQAPAWEPE